MDQSVDQKSSSMHINYKDTEEETEENVNNSDFKQNISNQVTRVEEYENAEQNASGHHENPGQAAPLGLDAITGESAIAKSTQQEVINMLLAQHGIISSSEAIDVSALSAQDSLTLHNAANTKFQPESNHQKGVEMHLPSVVHQSEIKEEHAGEEPSHREESIELNTHNQQQTDGNHPYLSSIATSDIGEQLGANSGYEVTAFVAEDGQGRHIIISGGSGYQDSSVVSISGHQVVSTVTENQLMTITSGDNSPVSMAGLENFGAEHVRISAAENDDGSTPTSYYVLEGSVPMSDAQNEMESNEQDLPKKVYQCTMEGCQKQFSTPYRLKAHGRSHTGQTFSCEEDGCQKTFITPSDLNKHTRTHTGDKPFFCDIENCGKVYSTAHHLKVHKRSHTGDKPFVCEWESCGKSFSTGYGLKSHYRTHTGERPYKCPESICDKAFKTSGDLQKHIRTHTGERPFKCLYEGCIRSFTTSNIRKVHMRTHTGERPYVCEIEGCDRSFASATNYKNHSRIHTGERPYACEVPGCNKSFTEYSSLYKHNVVHTQQKPYICNVCHKTYRQTSTLAMHKRTVHGSNDDSIAEAESNQTENTNEDLEPDSKRQKVSYDSNVALTTALMQGLPVMLNDEGAMNALQTHYAELAAQQQLSDASSVPGAIAIPIQVTMNPDGTIAGAQGISLTDSSGRIIPVSLSLTLPISSFASSLAETHNDDSIVTSEAVAAASAVNEIFSNQQDESGIDVQLGSDHVITEQIENHDVITPDSEHADAALENDEGNENTQVIASEGLGTQILIKTVSDSAHGLMTGDSEATTVRIAPRNYSADDADLQVIEETGSETVNRSGTNSDGDGESAVAMIIDEGMAHEQEEGDVTDRYLIKESLEVSDRTDS